MADVATLADQDRVRALDECLACGGRRLHKYADLGAQPLANDYQDGSIELAKYPLAVNVCLDCFHSQLTHSVDADLLYKNYLYVSGTTKTLLQSFDEFVDEVEATVPDHPLSVLDIASNDGTLLSRFAQRGHRVLGVDPAENLRALSEAQGVPTHVGYWGAATAAALGQKFDVIVAMNVLGHVPYPAEFLAACKDVLAPGGHLYIQTSQCEMVQRLEFDTIYHEHHSFFTTKSFQALAHRVGLTIVNGTKVAVHGTSYRWTLTADDAAAASSDDASVVVMLDAETALGYYALPTYERFGDSIRATAQFVRDVIADYTAKGYVAIGYGAAAKGNTLVNVAGVSLDYIVDDNPLKVGMRAPGNGAPIVPGARLEATTEPLCVIVLAWNFYDEIRERVAAQRGRADDVFVRYFPEREICTA
jgi:2-polyprenyl-3-methyl-5-hydroxy-6-metoxy-1,4-benzoquinol methylase